MLIILVAISLLFLYLSLRFSSVTKSPVIPAAVWLFAWSAMFMLAAVFGSDYRYYPLSLTVLVLILLAFPLGSLLGISGAYESHDENLELIEDITKFAPAIMIACGLIGIIGVVFVARALGISLHSLGSLKMFVALAKQAANSLHTGEQSVPTSASICEAFLQMGFAVCGVAVAARRFMKWQTGGLFALLIFVAMLWTAITTIRSYVLIPVLWYFGGFITTKVFLHAEGTVLNRRVIVAFCVVMPLALLTIIVVQSIRMGDYRLQLLSAAAHHMRPWFGGAIPGFCVWYFNSSLNQTVAGPSIFAGIEKTFGIAQQTGYVNLATELDIGSGDTTNAETAIKVFVENFGAPGAMLAAATFGFLVQRLYELARSRYLVGLGLLPIMMATVLYSPNYWFLGYGSRILAGILFFALVLVLSHFRESRSAAPEPSSASSGLGNS